MKLSPTNPAPAASLWAGALPVAALAAAACCALVIAATASAATLETPYYATKVEHPEGVGTRFGERGHAAGDLNEDGVGDFFVTGTGYSEPIGFEQRRVYAMSGSDRSLIYKIDPPTREVSSASLEFFADAIAVVDDLSAPRDGVSELAVGNTFGGRVYIFEGKTGELLRII